MLHAPCRLELGSRLRTGEWTSDGGWHELSDPPLQMPPGLHQIPTGALKKVWGSCVRALRLLWPLHEALSHSSVILWLLWCTLV